MENNTLEEFEQRLKEHDWRYEYSDDFGKWVRGDQEYKRLIRFASQSKEHQELFNKYRDERLNNKPEQESNNTDTAK